MQWRMLTPGLVSDGNLKKNPLTSIKNPMLWRWRDSLINKALVETVAWPTNKQGPCEGSGVAH
jgi:hypothetical protein